LIIRFRVVLSMLLIFGLLLLPLVLIAASVVFLVWAIADVGFSSALGMPAYSLIFMLFAAVGIYHHVLLTRPTPEGDRLQECQAPELWAMVRALCDKIGVRLPDEIHLIAEPRAMIHEETRSLGLRPGSLHLFLGLPLLVGLSVDQLKAVITHELGHYSTRDTRLSPLIYRGREAIEQATKAAETFWLSLWNSCFRIYYLPYCLISAAVLRRQEIIADRLAAEVVGPDVAVSALSGLPPLIEAWEFYLDKCVAIDQDRQYGPVGVCSAFGQYLAARPGPLIGHLSQLPKDRSSIWDTHPPMDERIAALQQANPGPISADFPSADNGQPAATLVPDLDAYDRRFFPIGDRTPEPLADYVIRIGRTEKRDQADMLYRAAGRVGGTPQANLTSVLNLLADGCASQLAHEVIRARPFDYNQGDAHRPHIAHALAEKLESAFAVTAVQCGAGYWRHSWGEGLTLVDAQGNRMETALWSATAATGTADNVAQVRTWLAAAGVQEAAGELNCAAATALGSKVVATMGSMLVNGSLKDVISSRIHNLLILEAGLLLLPQDFSGTERMVLERTQVGSVWQRDHLGCFASYEDICAAAVLNRWRTNVLFTLHDGRVWKIETTVWIYDYRSPGSRKFLTKVVNVVQAHSHCAAVHNVESQQRQITERNSPRRRYTVFIGVGSLLLAYGLVGAVYRALTTANEWALWPIAATGLLLLVLGLRRRQGRWRPMAGNAFKLTGTIWALQALAALADNVRDDQPKSASLLHLIFSAALYAVGVFRARKARARE
jgi:hypothetical protein